MLRSNKRFAPVYRSVRAIHLSSSFGTVEGQWLSKLVQPGSVAVDVGANVGQYTAVMNRALKNQGAILAFEPNPLAFNQLVLGTRGKKVEAHKVALSAEEGYMNLNVPVSNFGEMLVQLGSLNTSKAGSDDRQYLVPVKTLDSFQRKLEWGISVIKIDVEGHELQVLRGATATISKQRPCILIEVETRHQPTGQSVDDVFSYLLDFGYQVRGISETGLVDVTKALTSQHSNYYEDGAIGAGYINNFLCTPKELS